ncbi:MAG: 4Fe-4S binding protein [Chloroflexi bacterium]|nr:4Fe-4S binding protein [Chloroflexota bacterium]
MADLSVEFSGIRLKNPLMVGAGPNTMNFQTSLDCMKAGFGAIVIRSLHTTHLDDHKESSRGFWRIYSANKNYKKSLYSFQSTGAPAQRVHKNVPPGFGGAAVMPTLEEYTEEVYKITRAAKDYDCRVIASTGWCGARLSDEEVWAAEAKAMTEAGVDAIELHTGPSPATEPGRFITVDPHKYLEMPIKVSKQASNLPIFPKIPADCCDTIGMSAFAQKAGADGVVPVTRWISIPVDIENEKEPVWRGPGIGGPWSAPIMTGFVFRMRHADQPINYVGGGPVGGFPDSPPVTVPIIASGGVRSGADVIGYIMAGADAAQTCVQVILEGVGAGGRILKEMSDWMDRKGYQRVSDFQGTLKLVGNKDVLSIPQWQPVIDDSLCNGCNICVKSCYNHAMSLVDNKARVDDSYCEGCRTCYYVCPTNAISLKG